MRYVIDGSNVLGRAGADREATESKRALARAVAGVLAAEKGSGVLVFDGGRPADLGAIGGVTLRFSGDRTADDVIAALVESMKGGSLALVTADQGLAGRCRRREVQVVSPATFLNRVRDESRKAAEDTDWNEYFSKRENKIDF